ncbi:AraC family transcriptional regulator [Rhizobium sp. CNPSo 3464]|uniref:helix-turn-helix domain-containing protein n=1 Tax=Rhizobium sp. CNPSo 3464 TaxID=3021406 RepID=UPI000DD742B9|nr:AraC family transcriptional regulator [Rhizobium sp. CNPSo 3464]MDK4742570.1 AraC family transcriptional regulator [Rhizobium sp. CNPSo 3464]
MIGSVEFDPRAVRRAEHSAFSHDHGCWRSVRADVVRRTGIGRQETNISADNHAILLNILGVAKEGEDYLDGRRVEFKQRPAGSLSFVPADHSWSGWDDGDATAAYVFITIGKKFIQDRFENVPGTDLDRLAPTIGFEDPLIQYAARSICSEIGQGDPLANMMVENHASTIFGRLFRLSGHRRQYLKGGLSPAVLKRLIDKIDASLDGSLSLTELAHEAGLSEHYMSKAFRHSTGLPPHAFIIRRRVERASEMLRYSDRQITEIAYACGFSSPSHFAAAFRRVIGSTPKRYRADWKA